MNCCGAFNHVTLSGFRVNQWLYFLLSATAFPLSTWVNQWLYFPPQCYVSMLPAGGEGAERGKYIDVSGKWSRYFTLTPLSERKGSV